MVAYWCSMTDAPKYPWADCLCLPAQAASEGCGQAGLWESEREECWRPQTLKAEIVRAANANGLPVLEAMTRYL